MFFACDCYAYTHHLTQCNANFAGSNNKRDLKPRSGNLLNEITDHLPNYLIVLNNDKHSVLERPLVRVLLRKK